MTLRISKIEKSRIGLIQLRTAIQLYNKRDFISSITLAGAADEIFGGLAVKNNGYNTLDGHKNFWDGYAETVKKDKVSKGQIVKINNKTKNNLKHHDTADDTVISADFEFEAQSLIDSAIRNLWIYRDTPPSDRIINNYVDRHWT